MIFRQANCAFSRHYVQLINQRITDFKTTMVCGFSIERQIVVLGTGAGVEVNLFVSLVDFDIQPSRGPPLNSGIKDVTDLRIRWRKVTLVDFGCSTSLCRYHQTTSLTGTEAAT